MSKYSMFVGVYANKRSLEDSRWDGSEFKPKHLIDQKTSPSSGPGGVEASRSTEHRDSKGTLML